MVFVYTDELQHTIRVILDEGEAIGNLVGPTLSFVPTDPDNSDFAAIVAAGEPIAPFTRYGQ